MMVNYCSVHAFSPAPPGMVSLLSGLSFGALLVLGIGRGGLRTVCCALKRENRGRGGLRTVCCALKRENRGSVMSKR
jgi:hypothetical protein